MKTLILTRITALTVGAAAAGVGCYASYEAAARADGGYLCLAAPIVALAAAVVPVLWETALRHRQYLRSLALFTVWLPCVAAVVFTAIERNHLSKAGAEAARAALHSVVERAQEDRQSAQEAAQAAQRAADKVRGLDEKHCGPKCQSIRATETAAAARLAQFETALATAESKAVTETNLKQPDWLLPVALEGAGMMLIACGFGLGRRDHAAPAAPPLTKRQEAARRGVKTRKRNASNRAKARRTGPKLAMA